MTYPLRKQIYRRRAGALRYWMLAHVYVGAIAGVVLLLHSGTRTGGLLTSLLYVAFDLAILSGIVGIVAYIVAPRIMTRIEGEPLLVEDLEEPSRRIAEDMRTILDKSEGWLKEEIRDRVYPRFSVTRFSVATNLAARRVEIVVGPGAPGVQRRTTRLATDEERDLLLSAVETAVTLRRVDALLRLHRLLRFWIPMHVVSTAVMLALMVVHIAQVVLL